MPFGFPRDVFILLLITVFDRSPIFNTRMNRLLQMLTVYDTSPYRQHHDSWLEIAQLLTLYDTASRHFLTTRDFLFMDDVNVRFEGNDMFQSLSLRRNQFYYVIGETPETFLELYYNVAHLLSPPMRNAQCYVISRRNQLLLTLMWLRTYPNLNTLSLIFQLSSSCISTIINNVWPVLYGYFAEEIQWPSRQEWRNMRGNWASLPDAVGCIDGTSHRISRPSGRLQARYFSGHRHFHCIHTQVVIDNNLNIRHVEAGFAGHMNDAQSYALMTRMGDGEALDIPRNCFLLADCIYPSRHPLVTPFTRRQLQTQQPGARILNTRLNLEIRRHRVYVEHVIKLLKIFQVIGTLYRHIRRNIAMVCCHCAFLAERRTRLFFRW